ncbi:MAG: glycerol-3-phosphate cytidylyltransferase [Omnitrophica bacterium RIFCSPLOWO2_02_FULL_45_16]|nr:MAG: glycerol-3-phosphate cytidylyltransferase [Omnitrophica bacterium RIFCSPHIGHO2_02_FULL_46_20]OGW93742.1 MAG: glycerol-3-phosphate cytidylyltransferase [Omnitrophica bacterium RIFCSPLOWO2_01_FULL_45_24]OGW94086.1 MAG: glycerol-3-phosphate cytidylyltransferase [Omnitrophica bacterium RIFCSPLOWO2_12_FULL_45_13]OGX00852.1 MAG: glycerol-3-phosphate cytidylyltransferase [Omnitrophica bacterium RIFCSPLOWO2_02_FULL_45_16]
MNSKILTSKKLVKALSRLRSKGERIVFTNGCFDILHAGHIEYLSKAKRLGDILVIGLNSDSSVKKIKGKARPINKEADRAKVLAALYFVDYVTLFSEPTPERLIKELKPNILVKGGDWKVKDIVGGDFVKSCGGKVKNISFVKGYSTTSLIENMSSQC